MQVAGHAARPRFVKSLKILRDPHEGLVRSRRFEVADVLAHEHLRPDGQRHGVLQMRAHRQHGYGRLAHDRRLAGRQPHRQRCVTARAPQHLLAAQHHPRHRIIHVPDDGPVVDEKEVAMG